MSMQEKIQYSSEDELEDIVGTYMPGDFEDYDVSIAGVTDRRRETGEQIVTYDLENDLGQGSRITITWIDGEREDLVFEDDPVDYLEPEGLDGFEG